jgi:hypothetical protein
MEGVGRSVAPKHRVTRPYIQRNPVCRRISSLALLSVVVGGILSLSACRGSVGATTVASVSITPASTNVPNGGVVEFTATVNLNNATTSTSTAVTWEVNGTAGGNSTVGTIVSSASDNQIGVYTAPATVPTTNNGQVDVTAVAQQISTSTSSNTTTVTSNTAVVTIGVGTGVGGNFYVTPSATTFPAGGTIQFSAMLYGLSDANAAWSASSANGGDVGTIGLHSGTYTAPLYPPPGGSVTITAQDGTNQATVTLTINYSDRSLSGPYAFSYSGYNQFGFYAVAGSFVAGGNGIIESGVADVDTSLAGVSTHVPISGTYLVGADGRVTAALDGGTTWQFAMTTNQHALLIRVNANATGCGTIDQQNLDDLTNSTSAISGPYVFDVWGADASSHPLAIAGKFSADSSGQIPVANTILDANDGGSVTTGDRTLSGSYAFDTTFPGSGRGVLTFTSTPTSQRQFAFYIVDRTHLYLVEIDHNSFLVGDVFSAPTGNSFSIANLTSGSYAFTQGGNSSSGPYAAGGVFISDGAGNISGGVFDRNNGGAVQLNTVVGACPYTVDQVTGRLDLKLHTASGSCPSGMNSGVPEFAVYQTSQGSALMLELDASAVATGVAYVQHSVSASLSGSFALRVGGQRVFQNSASSYQQDAEGQVNLGGTNVSAGNLDINNYNSVYEADPVSTTSSLAAPTGTNGRGTAVISGTAPEATYNLIYYLIDGNTALLFDQDTTRMVTGIIARQF